MVEESIVERGGRCLDSGRCGLTSMGNTNTSGLFETGVRTSTGRVDAVVRSDHRLYVIELKYRHAGESSPTSSDALAQINARGYLLAWDACGMPVVKVGACYSEEARTLDGDWVAEGA